MTGKSVLYFPGFPGLVGILCVLIVFLLSAAVCFATNRLISRIAAGIPGSLNKFPSQWRNSSLFCRSVSASQRGGGGGGGGGEGGGAGGGKWMFYEALNIYFPGVSIRRVY